MFLIWAQALKLSVPGYTANGSFYSLSERRRKNVSRGMNIRGLFFATVFILCLGCNVPLRVGEVARVQSPSGRIDAIIIEANTGPKASSSYDVFLVPSGQEHNSGVHIASLYAARRSQAAFGVNLKWNGAEELSIEYLEASAAEILQEMARIEGEQVQVKLRAGIEDTTAAPGGMLDNIRKRSSGS
jgi:hypothetical protein